MSKKKPERDTDLEWLEAEYTKLSRESEQIDKICTELETQKTISRLLSLNKKNITPEIFEEAQLVIAFFRRCHRYHIDNNVYWKRNLDYNLRKKGE